MDTLVGSSAARVVGQVITPWTGDRALRYVWGPWLGARPWAGDRAWGVVGGGLGTDACAGVGGYPVSLGGGARGSGGGFRGRLGVVGRCPKRLIL